MLDDAASIEGKDDFCLLSLFFKQLRVRYDRKPILTDGAHWYSEACRWLRLDHHMYIRY
jgi:transposase-like protein